MNKVDSFLITILVLLCGIYVVYKTSEFQYSGVEFERQKNNRLVRQIKELQLKEKVASLEKLQNLNSQQNQRSIASLGEVKLSPTQKLKASEELLDNQALAESHFKQAKLACEKYKKEDVCTKNIEIVITQFPETRWAGESLLLLSRLYIKAGHIEKASDTIKIVKKEFKNDRVIQDKLAKIEKSGF